MPLLLAFASLVRTLQTTATAKELGVTQSAVSHSLAKLREIFGDDLFLRRAHGLEPTPRARALAPLVEAILEMTRGAVRPEAFDPKSAEGVVRIAATDYPCTVLAAPLLQAIEREAPAVRVSIRPFVRESVLDAIASREIDFAIGPFLPERGPVERTPLWTDAYAVAARRSGRAPRRGAPMTLKAYCAARHILVSQDGSLEGIVDASLAARKLKRTVVGAVPYFLSALATVSRSDAIVTMPSLVAQAHAAEFGLDLHACPVPVRELRVDLLERRTAAPDPLVAWVSGQIRAIAREATTREKPARAKGRSRRSGTARD